MPVVHRFAPFVSMLVTIAYLSAAFIDCEPRLVSLARVAGGADHVATASMTSAHSREASDARAASAPHGAQESHHAHSSQSAAQAPSDASDASDVHAADPRNGAHSESPRRLVRAGLEWRPTCLCGCSDTRATVGGSTSRLGSVIPAVHVPRLLELARSVVLDLEHDRLRPIHADRDLIPI